MALGPEPYTLNPVVAPDAYCRRAKIPYYADYPVRVLPASRWASWHRMCLDTSPALKGNGRMMKTCAVQSLGFRLALGNRKFRKCGEIRQFRVFRGLLGVLWLPVALPFPPWGRIDEAHPSKP